MSLSAPLSAPDVPISPSYKPFGFIRPPLMLGVRPLIKKEVENGLMEIL